MNSIFKSVLEEGLTRAQLRAIFAKGLGRKGFLSGPTVATGTTQGGTDVLKFGARDHLALLPGEKNQLRTVDSPLRNLLAKTIRKARKNPEKVLNKTARVISKKGLSAAATLVPAQKFRTGSTPAKRYVTIFRATK